MAHTELSLRERRTIEDMLSAKIPVTEIAAEIGRHRATVYREIKRNRYFDDELPKLNGYYGMAARPPLIRSLPCHRPDCRDIGANPARHAACFPFIVPSSGISISSAARLISRGTAKMSGLQNPCRSLPR